MITIRFVVEYNTEDFLSYLNKMKQLCEELNFINICFVRDFNAGVTHTFRVLLEDFRNENDFIIFNNIKAACYIGEVLLNHLMFADDICVFCPSVRWL